VLAQLDKISGVERSYANRAGNMVRISIAQAANPEKVVEEVARVFTQEKRNPIRLRDAELKQALEQEQWRTAEQVCELSIIEYRTLTLRALGTFADKEKLDQETKKRLFKVAEEEWDKVSKDGVYQDHTDLRARITERVVEVVKRAKPILTAQQFERFKDWVKSCLEGNQPSPK
jgi:hypothetical protein